jgi:hypothetical protein
MALHRLAGDFEVRERDPALDAPLYFEDLEMKIDRGGELWLLGANRA